MVLYFDRHVLKISLMGGNSGLVTVHIMATTVGLQNLFLILMALGIKELKMQHKKSTQQNNSPSLLLCRLSLVVSTGPISGATLLEKTIFYCLNLHHSFDAFSECFVNKLYDRM